MMFEREDILPVILALGVAMLISFIATPLVKKLAYKVGAVDVPKDNRRMHDHPIPRMGGLAIFIGCVVSIRGPLSAGHPHRYLHYCGSRCGG